MARVRWSYQALADLEAIEDFIARDAPSVAQVFVDPVFTAVKRLEAFPRQDVLYQKLVKKTFAKLFLGVTALSTW